MTLQGNEVVSAAPGVRGFDADTVIGREVASAFKSNGYHFCARYLSLAAPEQGDLTTQEALVILAAGLALMPVQHVREPGWAPDANLGGKYGRHAAGNANTVGFPPGVNVWCDLEGVEPGVPASAVIDYCNAWSDAVETAGYVPGLYVGFDSGLTGRQLGQELTFRHFWKSLSDVPAITPRGYQLFQQSGGTAYGIQFDQNTTQDDHEGGHIQWLVAER